MIHLKIKNIYLVGRYGCNSKGIRKLRETVRFRSSLNKGKETLLDQKSAYKPRRNRESTPESVIRHSYAAV